MLMHPRDQGSTEPRADIEEGVFARSRLAGTAVQRHDTVARSTPLEQVPRLPWVGSHVEELDEGHVGVGMLRGATNKGERRLGGTRVGHATQRLVELRQSVVVDDHVVGCRAHAA